MYALTSASAMDEGSLSSRDRMYAPFCETFNLCASCLLQLRKEEGSLGQPETGLQGGMLSGRPRLKPSKAVKSFAVARASSNAQCASWRLIRKWAQQF